jgi:hypothetical protein
MVVGWLLFDAIVEIVLSDVLTSLLPSRRASGRLAVVYAGL